MAIKQRDTYWDTLKGILIFLVVLGHTGSCLGAQLTSVIYIFHMPLFIFVSGYLSSSKSIDKFVKGIKVLLGFYLLFHTFYMAYDIINGVSLTFSRILTPSFGLWYLLSLCYWRSLVQFFSKSMERFPLIYIVGSIVLSIGVGFIPIDSQMSFQRTFTFLPFFILGYYTKLFKWMDCLKHLNGVVTIIFLGVLMVVVYLYIPPFYANTHFDELSGCLIRSQQLGLAFLTCICLLRIIPPQNIFYDEFGNIHTHSISISSTFNFGW